MIYMVTGLPRNGKTYYLTRVILRELRKGKRKIYTNVPLREAGVKAWLRKNKLPESRWLLITRLEPLQCRNFFMIRDVPPTIGPSDDLPLIYTEEHMNGAGEVYVISECHLVGFDAHRWAEIGPKVKFYISQHGKLNNDVYLESQHLDKVAKALKLDIQYYYEIEYMRRQHILVFQKGYHFKAKLWTGGEPESLRQKPNSVFPFWPNALQMACYDTTAGHGMAGNGMTDGDGQEFKGLPPWVGYIVISASLFCGYQVISSAPSWLMKKFFSGPSSSEKSASKPAAGAASAAVQPAQSSASAAASAPLSPLESIYPDSTPEKPVWVTGYALMGSRINVQLSDGRVLTERDPELAEVRRNAIHLKSGQRLFIVPLRPSAALATVAPVSYTPPQMWRSDSGVLAPYHGGPSGVLPHLGAPTESPVAPPR